MTTRAADLDTLDTDMTAHVLPKGLNVLSTSAATQSIAIAWLPNANPMLACFLQKRTHLVFLLVNSQRRGTPFAQTMMIATIGATIMLFGCVSWIQSSVM